MKMEHFAYTFNGVGGVGLQTYEQFEVYVRDAHPINHTICVYLP